MNDAQNDTKNTIKIDSVGAKSRLSHYASHPFRQYQEEAIEYIIGSDKRFVFLEAPTGSGKSLVSMVTGIIMGGVTYSVHSKTLQHQITSDFPEAKSLFGRSNYTCIRNPHLTCDECTHGGEDLPCPYKGECVYEVQKKKVLAASLRILNFDYLLTETNYVGRFSNSPFNIVDEADNLESTLINFTTLTFTSYALSRLGLSDYISTLHKSSKDTTRLLDSWKSFAITAKQRAMTIIKKLDDDIDNFPDDLTDTHIRTIKERQQVLRLCEKMALFIDNVDPSWVFDDSQEGKFIFRPLWLTPDLSEQFMWRHAKKWVFMSASFLPINLECKRLGIPLDEVDYKCLPSTFPADRRPLHIQPVANLTAKTMEEETPKLIAKIREIVDTHPNEKGLIHATSYTLAKKIIEGVSNVRLITHVNSKDRQGVLDRFINSSEPLVLVSPSLDRGVSLEMDLCRWIIVAKAPFLSLTDRVTSARLFSSKLGQEWYNATMMSTVLQQVGRGMRSSDDRCEAFILDQQFLRVYQSRPKYWPQWLRDAVVW